MSYDKKMVDLKITSLVGRRFWGDMIETYNIFTNKEGLNPGIYFKINLKKGGLRNKSGTCNLETTILLSQRVVNPCGTFYQKKRCRQLKH